MFQPITLGDKVKSVAIERYRADEKTRDIVCIASKQVGVVKMHYTPQHSYFYCFGGRCCEDCGLPNLRIVVPLICYSPLAGPDTFVRDRAYGAPITLKYLPLGKTSYEDDILTKQEITGDITKSDLLVTCSDAGFQKLKYDILGPCRWQTDPAIVAIVKELWGEYKALIGHSVARNLTLEQYVKLGEQEAKTVPDQHRSNRNQSSAPSHTQRPALPPPADASGLDIGPAPAQQVLPLGTPPGQVTIDLPAQPAQPVTPAPAVPGTPTEAAQPNFSDLLG